MTETRYLRRARPALGTLVEVGVRLGQEAARAAAAVDEAWRVLGAVERALSAFDPGSDVGRFNAAPVGASLEVGEDTRVVLAQARDLAARSQGLFDVSLGSGPDAWSLWDGTRPFRLEKLTPSVRLDLGGIGKGHAVDRAFEALAGRLDDEDEAGFWVNAGGDLRVTGVGLPIRLRDERRGGARPWLVLREGALATSRFAADARSRLANAPTGVTRYVSVASPRCLWSDALTKVVAATGREDHPLLAAHQATAWLHPEEGS
jgi:FAD:protein FMN transferase